MHQARCVESDLDFSQPSIGRLNLIAVLDWGLGHASRSLALAARLRAMGEHVCWASSGQALEMIRQETLGEDCFELTPYGIEYPTGQMAWNMILQAPKFFRAMRAERREIDQVIMQSRADRLISDSRFGCFSKRVPSIFLSHQLHPIVPRLVGRLYHHWIKPFDAYWVPDQAVGDRLSGALSEHLKLKPVYYVGYLSRIKQADEKEFSRPSQLKIGVLLSGPEPQRTKLENELLDLLVQIPGPHWLIRGLPKAQKISAPNHIRITDYGNALDVRQIIETSQLLVCRSGYSTLMDLKVLSRKAVLLIPTPGQTEQIYLAERAQKSGWAATARQGNLDVERIKDLLAAG
ncbi:MAG: glycosyltransferase [Bacteroidota bacterium]